MGPAPLMIGLGCAIDELNAVGIAAVGRHDSDLGSLAHAGLSALPELEMIGPARGGLTSAMVAARLPDHIDSRTLRDRLHDRHGIIIKMAEKRWFNGIRLSPHIFNDAAQVETAVAALRTELANWD